MATRTHDALAYHAQQHAELIALAWRMVEDDLDRTQAYRETLQRIAWHARLIAQLSKAAHHDR